MKNFYRALALALRYRWRVAALFACSLLVGILWGANISAIFPLIEIAFKGKSPQQWIAGEIAEQVERIDDLDDRERALAAQWAAAKPASEEARAIEREQALLAARVRAERDALAVNRWLEPLIIRWMPHDSFRTLALVVGILLVGTLLKSVFYIIHSIVSDCLVNLATYQLRRQFYRHTLKMDQASLTADGTSELMSRFTFDMENLTLGLKFLCQVATREPLKMAACFIGAAFICWRLLLVSLIIVPVGFYAMSVLSKLLKQANRKALEGMSRVYAVLEESIQGVQIVKAFTMERYERWRFFQASKSYFEKTMKIARYESLTSPTTELIGILTISLTLLVGAYLALAGETHLFGIQISERPLSLGVLLTFYGLMAGMSDPARKLSASYNRLQRAAAAADRIYALIDRTPKIADPIAPKALPRHARELEFDNISFSYDGQTPILQDVSLKIRYGETVAIVGPNGCGKSTMLQLLLRFYDPDRGSIKIDGIDIRELTLRNLRDQIGFVTQETILFQDTVQNNIRYGAPHATEAEIVAAAKKAHAHRFIEDKLASGYQTMLSERGGSLSGGQRQRLAIARAILRDPPLLILDEATSQVDLESEQLIHMVLEEFVQDRTTLIVTHRLSILALADRIVVMQQGRITAVGTHQELLKNCDFYRRLHDRQLRDIA